MNDAARMPCLVDHYAFTKDLVAPQGMNVLQPASAPDSFWRLLKNCVTAQVGPLFLGRVCPGRHPPPISGIRARPLFHGGILLRCGSSRRAKTQWVCPLRGLRLRGLVSSFEGHEARVAGLRDSWVANSGPLYARPKTCKCGLVRG